jgi:hypothetical protein
LSLSDQGDYGPQGSILDLHDFYEIIAAMQERGWVVLLESVAHSPPEWTYDSFVHKPPEKKPETQMLTSLKQIAESRFSSWHLLFSVFLLAPAALAQRVEPQDFPSEVAASMSLQGGAIGGVQVLESFDQTMVIGFEHPLEPLYLELQKHSVRADSFEVRVQLEDGSFEIAPSQPVNTYRGTVLGKEDSLVAASYTDAGLYARIQLANGREYWIEPVGSNENLISASSHVLYQTNQVTSSAGTCAADLIEQFRLPSPGAGSSAPNGGSLGVTTRGGTYALAAQTTAELGCDADYEYFQRWGSVSGVQNRIESVVNSMNIQYERDVSITHAITTIVVRSSSNDPYKRKGAEQLLNEFRNEWNSNQSGVSRDVAHLFTGRSLAGSTIGIAWIGQVCNLSYAYGLVQSDFDNNFACTTDLSAHELGHNWNAGHCSCTSYTMNAYITCANIFNPANSAPTISAYRDSQSCFGPVDPPSDPVSIHVGSINPGTQNAGQGKKYGKATVSIVTDTGSAAAGASVSGTFSGDYNESVAGVTDGSGNVVFLTSTTQKGGINFTFCVDSVSGSLPYVAGDNSETCDSL